MVWGLLVYLTCLAEQEMSNSGAALIPLVHIDQQLKGAKWIWCKPRRVGNRTFHQKFISINLGESSLLFSKLPYYCTSKINLWTQKLLILIKTDKTSSTLLYTDVHFKFVSKNQFQCFFWSRYSLNSEFKWILRLSFKFLSSLGQQLYFLTLNFKCLFLRFLFNKECCSENSSSNSLWTGTKV